MTANETPRGNGGLENLVTNRISPQFTARSRPLALDSGTSTDAADLASPAKLGTVKTRVLDLLRERPCTDDELVAEYLARTAHPAWPVVTPQRLRTARAALVREGSVRDSGAIGFSDLGNRATVWEVAR